MTMETMCNMAFVILVAMLTMTVLLPIRAEVNLHYERDLAKLINRYALAMLIPMWIAAIIVIILSL